MGVVCGMVSLVFVLVCGWLRLVFWICLIRLFWCVLVIWLLVLFGVMVSCIVCV